MADAVNPYTGTVQLSMYPKHRVPSKYRLYQPSFPILGFSYSPSSGSDQKFIVLSCERIERTNLRWKVVKVANPQFNVNIPEHPITNPKTIPLNLPSSVRCHSWNNFIAKYVGPGGRVLVFMEQNYHKDGTWAVQPGAVLELVSDSSWSVLGYIDPVILDTILSDSFTRYKRIAYSKNSRIILTPRYITYTASPFLGPIASCDSSFSIILPTKSLSLGHNPMIPTDVTYAGGKTVATQFGGFNYQYTGVGLGICRHAHANGNGRYTLYVYVYVGEPPTFTNGEMNPIGAETKIIDTFILESSTWNLPMTEANAVANTYYPTILTDKYRLNHTWNEVVDGNNVTSDVPTLCTFILSKYEGYAAVATKLAAALNSFSGKIPKTYVGQSYNSAAGGNQYFELVDFSMFNYILTIPTSGVIGSGPHYSSGSIITTSMLKYMYETEQCQVAQQSGYTYVTYVRCGYMTQFGDTHEDGDYFIDNIWDYAAGSDKILGRRMCIKSTSFSPNIDTYYGSIVESSDGGITWLSANANDYSGIDFTGMYGDGYNRQPILVGGLNPNTNSYEYLPSDIATSKVNPGFDLGFIVPGCYLSLDWPTEESTTISNYILTSNRTFIMPASRKPIYRLTALSLSWPQGTPEPIPDWTWNGNATIIDYVEVELDEDNAIPTSTGGTLPQITFTYTAQPLTQVVKSSRLWAVTAEELQKLGYYATIGEDEVIGLIPRYEPYPAAPNTQVNTFYGLCLKVLPNELAPEYSTTSPDTVPPNPTNVSLDIPSGSLGSYRYGYNYVIYVGASGGVTPYTWSIINGSLPVGFSLGTATGLITGIVSGVGEVTYEFTVRVVDSSNPATFSEQTYSLTMTT